MTSMQPVNDAPYIPGMNDTPGQRYHIQVLSSGKTSSLTTHTDDTNFNNDTDCRTFPWKLHSMLEAAANEGFDHIVSWLDNEASFKVHQPALFVKHILPRFFKRQSKYKSFQRQLNLWQFQRLIGSKGPCNGGYFHALFHRHDTSLFHLMKRSKLSPLLSSFQESSSHDSFENDLFENFEMPKVLQHSRKCLVSTKESEPLNIYSSCMLLSEQNVDIDTSLLHSDIMSHGACSSVANFDELRMTLVATSKPQDPNDVASEFVSLTSTYAVLPKCWEMDDIPMDSFHDCTGNDRRSLSSQEPRMPGHYFSSSLDDVFGSDELPPQGKSDEGSAPERRSSSVLSAEDWKYVLVGMQIAMNAE